MVVIGLVAIVLDTGASRFALIFERSVVYLITIGDRLVINEGS
jgi:hypothetical protein